MGPYVPLWLLRGDQKGLVRNHHVLTPFNQQLIKAQTLYAACLSGHHASLTTWHALYAVIPHAKVLALPGDHFALGAWSGANTVAAVAMLAARLNRLYSECDWL